LGAITAWHLDARNAANFALAPRFELRPDDIIFIAQQPVTKWSRAVSQILPQILSVGNAVTK
ncbi:MAG TPA: sugar transporter, partial [Sulfitobacter pontiacus]|nr:sugar transporter [Sulfitobacter pontiacus]